MGFRVKTAPGKIEVFHPAERKRIEPVPRWRIAGALMMSSLFAGVALAIPGGWWVGFVMLATALVLLWAASR